MKISKGMEIHHDGDLPKQTGLGTSSSFTVGLLNSLHALKGEMTTPLQLAKEAIHVERNMCGDNVGSQDQITAAHGGLNHINFSPGDNVTVKPIILPTDKLKLFQNHLMLFFTGFSRLSTEIAAEQIKNMPKKEKELKTMYKMVDEGIDTLTGKGDISDFGRLLNESWQLKRTLGEKVSTDTIDAIYNKALNAGAIGGKLCGAGGGGFILLFVEPDKQPAVIKAMDNYLHVPFEFEWRGSQIIFIAPNSDAK
ncbi:kinase [Verrucomicrobiota bacterium]